MDGIFRKYYWGTILYIYWILLMSIGFKYEYSIVCKLNPDSEVGNTFNFMQDRYWCHVTRPLSQYQSHIKLKVLPTSLSGLS